MPENTQFRLKVRTRVVVCFDEQEGFPARVIDGEHFHVRRIARVIDGNGRCVRAAEPIIRRARAQLQSHTFRPFAQTIATWNDRNRSTRLAGGN